MAEEKEKTMTITVKMPKGTKNLTAVLKYPGFDEFRMASMALQSASGKADYLGCGRQFIKLCWVSGDEALKNGDESKDKDLQSAFVAASMDAYNEFFTAFDTEVKKN